MPVSWLIENDVFEESVPQKMADFAMSQGMPVKFVGYRPFGAPLVNGKTMTEPHDGRFYYDNECVVFYGSINCCRRLLHDRKWEPTAWMNLPNMRCSSYYAHWGQWALQREYAIIPWAELDRLFGSLYEKFGVDECIFAKPNENVKTFDGKVVFKDNFRKWYDQEEYCYAPDPESLCVVARPQKINAEWRIVICEGKVITGSQYKVNSNPLTAPGVPVGAMELADTLARNDWQPDKAYVLDVGLVGDEYRMVEIGSVNCAGLYECEVDKVVTALSSLAERQWKDIMGE